MNTKPDKIPIARATALLAILICLIYANTIHSSWHMDDFHNIVQNPEVQMVSLDMDSVIGSLYAAPYGDNLYRPVAYLTFALNWFWGQDNVEGFHAVNISIHILTTLFLFLTVILLYQTPNAGQKDGRNIYFIAVLSTVFWAVHPIQTQALTYIVQRMASMAALFYIIGLFCYLKARTVTTGSSRLLFAGLCGLAFVLGIGSKNNAVMLPVSLLLTEFVFFSDLTQKSTQRKALLMLFGTFLVVAAFGIFIFMDGDFNIFEGYEKRPFSMYQRLLTQPGIVLFYLSQICYPVADRFSITHDVTYANSVISPWTTLPSIIILLLLISLSIWRIKKNPFLSFALLFFFVNHIIESTIIPLEMVFEHRNYLPSLFLFVPVAAAIKKILDYYRSRNKFMYFFFAVSLGVMVMGLSMSTYIRNMDWYSEKTLWQDAMGKAPKSARPMHGLAWGHYEPAGKPLEAVKLYLKAVHLKDDQIFLNAVIYYNLAVIYYKDLKEYEKAAAYAQKAIRISETYYEPRRLLCNALGMQGRYDESLACLDQIILEIPDDLESLYLKGFILMKLMKLEMALPYFRDCLRLAPDNWKYLREIGFCLTQMGYYDRGFWFLKRSKQIHPKDQGGLLALADNRIRAHREDEAAKFIDQFLKAVGIDNVEKVLIRISENPLGVNVCFKDLAALISCNILERSNNYSEIAARLTQRFDPS